MEPNVRMQLGSFILLTKISCKYNVFECSDRDLINIAPSSCPMSTSSMVVGQITKHSRTLLSDASCIKEYHCINRVFCCKLFNNL